MTKSENAIDECSKAIINTISDYVNECLGVGNTVRYGFLLMFIFAMIIGVLFMFIGLILDNMVIRSLLGLLVRFYGILLFSAGVLLLYTTLYKEKIFNARIISLTTLAVALMGIRKILNPFSNKGKITPVKIMRLTSLTLIVVTIVNLVLTILFAGSFQIILLIMSPSIIVVYILTLLFARKGINELRKKLDHISVKIKVEPIKTQDTTSIREYGSLSLREYVINVMKNLFNISHLISIEKKVDKKINDMYISIFTHSMIVLISALAPYIAKSMRGYSNIADITKERINIMTFVFAISEILKTHLDIKRIYDFTNKIYDKDKNKDKDYDVFVKNFLKHIQAELSGSSRIVNFELDTLKLLGTRNLLLAEITCISKTGK